MQQNPHDASSESNRSQIYNKEELWYPWKCVSLVRENGNTLDLTIGDENSMMCFLHCLYHLICKPREDNNFLKEFKLRKIKMKLHFEADSS